MGESDDAGLVSSATIHPRLDRRRALVMLGLGAASRRALFPAHAAQNRRPNVVLIVTDDLNASLLAEMPNISVLLGQEGTTFANFFVTDPSCGPSRASILRGQYVHNHGMLSNGDTTGGFSRFHDLGREASTIATWLHDAGYRTGLFGKYLNGYPTGVDETHVPPGWDEWFGLISTQYLRYKVNHNGQVSRAGTAAEDYQTDVISRQARAFITQSAAAGQPFFAYIAPKAPHDPADPAPRHADAFPAAQAPRSPSFNEADVSDKPAHMRATAVLDDRLTRKIDEHYRQRLQTMLAVDELVADLIETLRETQTLDDTIIFFTADNGYFSGEHRVPVGKGLPYDESLRVPLLVRGSGIASGRVEDRLANNADLAPTIADLVGVSPPAFVDGRSLAPLLRGEAPAVWRHLTLVEDIAKLYSVDEDSTPVSAARQTNGDEEDERSDGPGAIPAYRALRAVEWLYVEYATGERELYDVGNDPYQMENLADTVDPGVMDALADRLHAMAECAGDACRTLEDEPLELPGVG